MLSRRSLIAAAMLAPATAQAQRIGASLQQRIDLAARERRILQLAAATYEATGLTIPDGAHIAGMRGQTRFVATGGAPLLRAAGGKRITLEGLTFDGADRALPAGAGLIELNGVADLILRDCEILRSRGDGIRLNRCGGRISNSVIHGIAKGGLFSLDATGLAIEGNSVSACGENGIQIWRSAKGDDATRVSGNRIFDIRADAAGSGQYGNAVSVFRAGGVIVEGNHMRRCAYTAVRNNSGSNIAIANNNCAEMGECAIYIEFGFDGASVTGNIIDRAMMGISVTNFADQGGRLASVSGNVIRNLRRKTHPGTGKIEFGIGIAAEGDAAITGNTIESADHAGLMLGWGPSLRDVAATGNVIRDAGIGVIVSVAPGAGKALIANNVISASRRAAIAGMAWDKIVTPDLAREPAAAPANVKLGGNLIS